MGSKKTRVLPKRDGFLHWNWDSSRVFVRARANKNNIRENHRENKLGVYASRGYAFAHIEMISEYYCIAIVVVYTFRYNGMYPLLFYIVWGLRSMRHWEPRNSFR